MASWLHDERLGAVVAVIRGCGARRVLDLGCGDGDLVLRLADEPGIARIVGIDLSRPALDRLRARLADTDRRGAAIDLVERSVTEAGAALAGFDCAALVEVIEHLDPAHLSRLETAVFEAMRPGTVIVTTPNAEFNPLLGVPPARFRHPGHRFEWGRARFRRWGAGVAGRHGYDASYADIGGRHPDLGGASQMAVFRRRPPG
ncbi:MAG: methyltransferase domain-containing protein [Gemmobacter sp.]